MKKIKLSLGVLAFVFGISAAFAFKPVDAIRDAGTAEFYVNPDGSAGDPVLGTSSCDGLTDPICSQEYNLDNQNQPTTATGNPAFIKVGERQ